MDDRYHKDNPLREVGTLQTCTSWQNLSCCTHALTVALNHLNLSMGLYNFSHDLCGTLSPRCAEFNLLGYVVLCVAIPDSEAGCLLCLRELWS